MATVKKLKVEHGAASDILDGKSKCIICKKETPTSVRVTANAEKLLQCIGERAILCDGDYPQLASELGLLGRTPQRIDLNGITYHRECYQKVCHKDHIERARKRYNRSVKENTDPNEIKVKGRPKQSQCHQPYTRSHHATYENVECFFCQKQENEKLHEIQTEKTRSKFVQAVTAQGSNEEKVNMVSTGMGHGVKYHRTCWMRRVENTLRREQSNAPKQEPSCTDTGSANNSSEFKAHDENKEKHAVIFECAKILRDVILDSARSTWDFNGSFENVNDYIPEKLRIFLTTLLLGPVDEEQVQGEMNTVVKTISDIVLRNIKTQRQVVRLSDEQVEAPSFRIKEEYPLQMGLGLTVHHMSRNKDLISLLHSFGICADYKKILNVETNLAEAVLDENMQSGVFVPNNIQNGRFIFFAIDNSDFNEDTPDGKNTTHATATAIYQQVHQDDPVRLITPKKASEKKISEYKANIPSAQCPKPRGKKYISTFENAPTFDVKEEEKSTAENLGWLMCKTSRVSVNEKSSTVPSWGAFNSLLTATAPPITRVASLPLLMSPPSDWSTLYSALKQAQQITTAVLGPDRTTVITLDLQLYEKAKQLEHDRPEMAGKYIFRMGELHTCMAALRAVGTFIRESGIDDAWIESEIYGPATTTQILDCKHYKRAMTAHSVTLQTVFALYKEAYFESLDPVIRDEMNRLTSDVVNAIAEGTQTQPLFNKLKAHIETHTQTLREFNTKNKERPMFQFYTDYIDMMIAVLNFVKATRTANWALHLSALQSLAKYFFAFDRQKYARMTPVYLAEMEALKNENPEVWNEFNAGNFVVNKNAVPFCAIGPDHGIEHENKWMKELGGLVGITRRDNARDRLFLIAPELNRICKEFKQQASPQQVQKDHHEMSPAVTKQQDQQVDTLIQTFRNHINPFSADETEDQLMNIVTHVHMPEDIVKDMGKIVEEGQKELHKFYDERLVARTKSIWAPMKKVGLKTWQSYTKNARPAANKTDFALKNDRTLFSRCLLIGRSRPEINIKEVIGQYELVAYPRSLFDAGGNLLRMSEKSRLMKVLTERISSQDANMPAAGNGQSSNKVIIIDGMAALHETQKPTSPHTCADFAHIFCDKIKFIGDSFSEIHVVFDRYDVKNSRKEATRGARSKNQRQIHLTVSDNTPLTKIPLNQLLSNSRTKDLLTAYLSEKLIQYFRNDSRLVVVAYRDTIICNSETDQHRQSLSSTQEEADTKMILHAMYTADRGFDSLVVRSPDTDVLVLLISHFHKLPKNTVLCTSGPSKRMIDVSSIQKSLGCRLSGSIIGFHAFSGCDQTGRFASKGKWTCWQSFLSAPESVQDAFFDLGRSEEMSDATIQSLEQFVCLLYKTSSSRACADLRALRWKLFCCQDAEGERLPPTPGAVRQVALRAHHQAFVWHHAGMPHPPALSADDYGWKTINNEVIAVVSHNPPAPDCILQLVRCKCQKSPCSTNHCTCRKNGLVCTDMCLCKQDQNEETCRNCDSD